MDKLDRLTKALDALNPEFSQYVAELNSSDPEVSSRAHVMLKLTLDMMRTQFDDETIALMWGRLLKQRDTATGAGEGQE